MPDNLTLVTCFPVDDPSRERIRAHLGNDIRWIESDQSRLQNDLYQADIFLGHAKTPVDWPSIVAAGRLKWIQSTAAGLDHCLHPSVIESEIVISGCSGLFADQVAEQTMALLLGLARGIPRAVHQQSQQQYQRYPTLDVTGRRVGILGFGGNGQRIADVIAPFASGIMATDLFADQVDHPRALVLPPEKTIDVASQSDVLIITLPLMPSTRQMVAHDVISALPKGSIFINVGRGAVVDTDALVQHAGRGSIAAVGIDVVDPEPLPPGHPLWTMDQVLITPHIGAQSRHRIPQTVEFFLSNWHRFRQGKALINQVDKRIGLPRPEHRLPRVRTI